MIKNIFGFVKNNFVYLIIFTAISLLGFLAYELSSMTSKVENLQKVNSSLELSVSNVQSDKDLLTLSLESERDLRIHLQETIKDNSKRIEGYLVKLGELEKNQNEKVTTLETTAKNLTTENCINSTMPDDIIGLFSTAKSN